MTAQPAPACIHPLKPVGFLRASGPGVLLCLLVSVLAIVLEGAETHLLGKAWLESLNLALLLGVLIRAVRTPGPIWAGGIRLCARTLLNVAIVCLGASFSLHAVFCAGPALLMGVMGIVLFSMVFTLLIGRATGLPTHQLLLIACGNAICGNSAIMAAAPVIGAKEEDIGTTIAFTAAGGLVVVLGLPLLAPALLSSPNAQGVLAGLTVYAVPQVVAAATPFGQPALHVGTLVKLMRVLMLGPVCLALAVFCAKQSQTRQDTMRGASFTRLVPWYITGFAAMMTARSCDLVPDIALAPLSTTATCLTTMAMAALGLSVELRAVLHAGRPLALSVFLSLLGLVGASLILVRLLFGA